MFELILLFTAMVLFMYGEISGFNPPKCTYHDWSKDLSNDQLVCLNCDFRIK